MTLLETADVSETKHLCHVGKKTNELCGSRRFPHLAVRILLFIFFVLLYQTVLCEVMSPIAIPQGLSCFVNAPIAASTDCSDDAPTMNVTISAIAGG